MKIENMFHINVIAANAIGPYLAKVIQEIILVFSYDVEGCIPMM